MAESLRDQLLKSGIVKQVREEKRPSAPQGGKPFPQRHGGSPSKGGKPGQHKPQGQSFAGKGSGKSQDEIDLAKAYAIRAQTEANERKRAEQAAAEEARVRRERKLKIQQLLEGKTLNKPDVDHVRHFEYGGKIRRVHVDADQLKAINAGELGVVQQQGRYLVVTRELAEQVSAIDPNQIALLVTPGSEGSVGEDGVPDDLMW
ncbi:DUF2058 domain-containing protein [Dyella japonica]|uniref:Nucleoprotein/polynucleotide-associated enzyme n=1 Tax=Dyella japonica A8 TaxID=1217721 RepID=A0A075K2W5_9GAMM|nr:DUF2058 family protein [Dyella japonica]AIF48360.1 nucleoprotein/polynucleotide-associated enzyme [Dyella japonica A8]